MVSTTTTQRPVTIATTQRAGGNLTEANAQWAQWAQRPADQRFWTIDEMASKARHDKTRAIEATVAANALRFDADGNEVLVVGERGVPARMTHYAFGQAAGLVGAPAHYLRTLPAPLAARCLSTSYAAFGDDRTRKLLMRRDGTSLTMQGSTSEKYARVWNEEIVAVLERLRDGGWAVPPARPAGIDGERVRVATIDDVRAFEKVGAGGGGKVHVGDRIAPAGLYMSDHDLWAFLVDPTRPIDNGAGGSLFPFVMIQQSEVGDCSIWAMRGYLNGVCGNHIVWGAREVIETRVIHRGKARDRWADVADELAALRGASTRDDESIIAAARVMRLGEAREDVAKLVHGKRLLTQKDALAAMDACEQHPEDGGGDPLSAWGLVQGITRISQRTPFADERAALDRAAGRVLQMAF